MKKKLFLFIFLVAFCFIVKPDDYRAEYVGKIKCIYEIETSSTPHTLEVNFVKYAPEKEWQIDYTMGKGVTYYYATKIGPTSAPLTKNLKNFQIDYYLDDSDTPTCPSSAEVDMEGKTIKLSSDAYKLNWHEKDGDELVCDYIRYEGETEYTYNIRFDKDGNVVGKAQWNSESNQVGGTTRSTDTYGPSEYSYASDVLVCPPYLIDDGNTLTMKTIETYTLSTWDRTSSNGTGYRCNYFMGEGFFEYVVEFDRDNFPDSLKLEKGGKTIQYSKSEEEKIFIIYDLLEFDGEKLCPIHLNVEVENHYRSEYFNKYEEIYDLTNKAIFIYSDVEYNVITDCFTYQDENSCEANTGQSETRTHACVWNEEYGFCNVTGLTYLKCGTSHDIPEIVPILVSYAVIVLKVVTPLILIFVSFISLVKAVAAQKEDEIKKAQNKLVKRIIAAVLVFFVITIVQFVILKVADDDEHDNIKDCFNCMLNNNCEGAIYFKDGKDFCHYVDDIYNAVLCDE